MLKAILWLVRKGLLFGPSAVIAVWGYNYLRVCCILLLAPNQPVELRYAAPAGSVLIQARSYAIDLRRRRIFIKGLRIQEPKGQIVASTELVDISNLDLKRGADQNLTIDIYHLRGSLKRDSKGQFELASLLPHSEKSTSKFPYRVRVHDADVELIDLEGTPWRQHVQSSDVSVEGAGPDWVAFGTAYLPGMGVVSASVQEAAQYGIQISGQTHSLQAKGIVAHLLSDRSMHFLDPVRELKLTEITGSGPFKVFVPADKKFTFQAQISGAARDVVFQKYKLDRLSFTGLIGANGAAGLGKANIGANTIEANGSLGFQGGVVAGAQVSLACPDSRNIPEYVSRLIPKGLAFQGAKYHGWVAYVKGKQPMTQGVAVASRGSYRNEVATNIGVAVFANPDKVRADLQHVAIAGTTTAGAAQIDLHKKSLTAFLAGGNLRLDDIGKLTHTQGISGLGSVKAIVSGAIARPEVSFLAEANGSYHHDKYKFGPDNIQLAGKYQNNAFQIRRGYLNGVDGLVAISGKGSATGTQLDMDVEGRNFRPGRYVAGLDGVASLSAKITGDYRDPKANGVLRGIDLTYQGQTVAAAVADFAADRSHFFADRIGAVSGTIDLEGQLDYGFKLSALAGKFSLSGIELAQFAGDKAAGIVDAPTIQLNGTLQKPILTARLEGSNMVGGDVLIDSAEALVTATPLSIVVDHATANFAGGSISGNAVYDIRNKVGSGVATSTPLDLTKLAPALGQTISVKGSASVTEAKFGYDKGLITGKASGKLEKVTANGAPAGDGNWTMTSDGTNVGGNLSIGELSPELRVIDVDASYNLKDKTITGSFDADRSRLRDIVSASLRYLPESVTSNPDILSATGDLTVGAKFSGLATSPDVSIETFQLDNFLYKTTPLGSLVATNLVRSNRNWTIPNLTLSGPEGTITANGTVAEQGALSATVTGKNLKASSLGTLLPTLAGSGAMAEFKATATGETIAPDVVGNLSVTHLAPAYDQDGKATPDKDFKVAISNFGVKKGSAIVKGTYDFGGFAGSFDGNGPFSYEDGFGTRSVNAHVVLDQKKLKDLPFVTSFIDPARSAGMVMGDIKASGALDNLTFDGGINFTADSLAFKFAHPNPYLKQVDDELKNVSAKLYITNGKTLSVDASAGEIRGGTVALNAGVSIADLTREITHDSAGFVPALLNSPLTGSVQAKGFAFRQSILGGFLAATVNGKTPLAGTLGSPAIGTKTEEGEFAFSGVDTALPNFPSGSGTASVATINPTFNLNAKLADAAHIHSSTADLFLTGDASLKGSLSDPQAGGSLVVASGTVRLPGGAVRLSQGGTVAIGYRSSFAQAATASVVVDLEGRTSITAIRYGQNTQRYDITVDITGDLLQENGLHFDAISDPPDLSSDDVLALLGQKNLVESLGNTDQADAERRVRDALVGFALPSLLDPYTSTLAHSIGLDYINFEYNSVDLATVDVARSISPDFTLQYRQQLGTAQAGTRPIYDFRLVYTPRRGPLLLRRLSLSAGTDQERPWKVALEYGTRFGGYSGPAPKNRTVISSPTKP